MNRNYLLQSPTGRFVLRRYDYNTNLAAIRYEHSHLASLPHRLHHATVPKPLTCEAGDTIVWQSGHFYALFPFIEGQPFDRTSMRLVREAGLTLAAYHNAAWHSSSVQAMHRQRPTYGAVARLDWVARHSSSLDQLWSDVASLPTSNPREHHIRQSIGFLKDEAAYLRSTLSARPYQALPKLVIHNDFGPQNLLCAGSRVSGLLDFDLVTYDARVYDLALALFWFAEDPEGATVEPPYRVLPGDRPWAPNAGRARSFYRGYADSLEKPPSQAEIDLLPSLMRVVPLWFAIWYLDLLVAGQEWHPEELSGILSYQQWFAPRAEAYTSSVVC